MAQNTASKQTKKAQLIVLLSGAKSVSLDTLSSALGWQRHTTSAAMTRLKQAGHKIISEKTDGAVGRTYRIEAVQDQPQPSPGGKSSTSLGVCDAEAEQQ
jgi:biotin operon repressor